MGASKTEIFTSKQNRLALIAKALSHPARIAILEHLIKTRSCMCGDIVEHVPLAQATVSQHLKELKNAGIIKGTISGTNVCYCLDDKSWKKIYEMLSEFFDQLNHSKIDCC